MDTPALDLSVPPFNLLSQDQVQRLSAGLHLEYFESGQVIVEAGSAPEGVFVIIKGKVEEYDGDSVERDSVHLVAQYSEGDLFGSLAVLKGQASDAYIAYEEVICQILPGRLFLDLVHENPEFPALLSTKAWPVCLSIGRARRTEKAMISPWSR